MMVSMGAELEQARPWLYPVADQSELALLAHPDRVHAGATIRAQLPLSGKALHLIINAYIYKSSTLKKLNNSSKR